MRPYLRKHRKEKREGGKEGEGGKLMMHFSMKDSLQKECYRMYIAPFARTSRQGKAIEADTESVVTRGFWLAMLTAKDQAGALGL